jgi:hypothetical protein
MNTAYEKAILSCWGRLNETTRNFGRPQTTDINIMPFGKHGFELDGYKIYSGQFKKMVRAVE